MGPEANHDYDYHYEMDEYGDPLAGCRGTMFGLLLSVLFIAVVAIIIEAIVYLTFYA